MKFIQEGKFVSLSALMNLVDMINNTREIKPILCSIDNITLFLARVMYSHSQHLTESILDTPIKLYKVEPIFERKRTQVFQSKTKSLKIEYPKEYYNYVDLFGGVVVHLLNSKVELCVEYASKILFALSYFEKGSEKIFTIQKLNQDFLLSLLGLNEPQIYTLMAIQNMVSMFPHKYCLDENIISKINSFLRLKKENQLKPVIVNIFYTISQNSLSNIVQYSCILEILETCKSLLSNYKIDFLYQTDSALSLFEHVSLISAVDQQPTTLPSDSSIEILRKSKEEEEDRVFKILSFINSIISSKFKDRFLTEFCNELLSALVLNLLKSDNEHILSQTWRLFSLSTEKEENLVFKSLPSYGKSDFFVILENFILGYMKKHNKCDFYSIDFSPFFRCNQMRKSMTLFVRKLLQSDPPLRKKLTQTFGQHFLNSYIDLVTKDKQIFLEITNSLTIDKKDLVEGSKKKKKKKLSFIFLFVLF